METNLYDKYEKTEVDQYLSYVESLKTEKGKDGKPKNYWATQKTDKYFIECFEKVKADGLTIDGKNVSLQSTGISYSYVAYKNKMLLTYPESKIDMAVVVDSDEFEFSKEDGVVHYKHNITNPFKTRDEKNIIGAFCVIKNNRGQFLTLLSKEDIEKHRNVAKQQYIWNGWFKEMALKTVIKKAVKDHFQDIYTEIEEKDNENYNINNSLDIDIELKKQIDDIEDLDELRKFYFENKNKPGIKKQCGIRSEEIKQLKKENENT